MTLIAENKALSAFCRRLSKSSYITVDTEFIRDRTYWPRLCLIQLAGEDEAAAVDTLVPGLDLAPVFALMGDHNILKVFHAARQDIEIFYHLSGDIPAPLFDTQVAAMVCGFGEAASYETLVAKLARARIDKTARFTDWSRRPLTRKQLKYALDDVIHLRTVYERLSRRLERSGRAPWLEEEMATLTDPATYRMDPQDAWRRLKTRSANRRYLAVLRELAAWRQTQAEQRDVPRNRILRDEALSEIAATAPTSPEELARARSVPGNLAKGPAGKEILAAVARAQALPEDALPEPPERAGLPPNLGPVVDLLKVLLKTKCTAEGVAQKLVASAADLEAIAADDAAPVPALHGWRRQLFGEEALALKHGRLGLTARGRKVRLVELRPQEAAAKTKLAGS